MKALLDLPRGLYISGVLREEGVVSSSDASDSATPRKSTDRQFSPTKGRLGRHNRQNDATGRVDNAAEGIPSQSSSDDEADPGVNWWRIPPSMTDRSETDSSDSEASYVQHAQWWKSSNPVGDKRKTSL
eukprot:gene12381-14625_t